MGGPTDIKTNVHATKVPLDVDLTSFMPTPTTIEITPIPKRDIYAGVDQASLANLRAGRVGNAGGTPSKANAEIIARGDKAKPALQKWVDAENALAASKK